MTSQERAAVDHFLKVMSSKPIHGAATSLVAVDLIGDLDSKFASACKWCLKKGTSGNFTIQFRKNGSGPMFLSLGTNDGFMSRPNMGDFQWWFDNRSPKMHGRIYDPTHQQTLKSVWRRISKYPISPDNKNHVNAPIHDLGVPASNPTQMDATFKADFSGLIQQCLANCKL